MAQEVSAATQVSALLASSFHFIPPRCDALSLRRGGLPTKILYLLQSEGPNEETSYCSSLRNGEISLCRLYLLTTYFSFTALSSSR